MQKMADAQQERIVDQLYKNIKGAFYDRIANEMQTLHPFNRSLFISKFQNFGTDLMSYINIENGWLTIQRNQYIELHLDTLGSTTDQYQLYDDGLETQPQSSYNYNISSNSTSYQETVDCLTDWQLEGLSDPMTWEPSPIPINGDNYTQLQFNVPTLLDTFTLRKELVAPTDNPLPPGAISQESMNYNQCDDEHNLPIHVKEVAHQSPKLLRSMDEKSKPVRNQRKSKTRQDRILEINKNLPTNILERSTMDGVILRVTEQVPGLEKSKAVEFAQIMISFASGEAFVQLRQILKHIRKLAQRDGPLQLGDAGSILAMIETNGPKLCETAYLRRQGMLALMDLAARIKDTMSHHGQEAKGIVRKTASEIRNRVMELRDNPFVKKRSSKMNEEFDKDVENLLLHAKHWAKVQGTWGLPMVALLPTAGRFQIRNQTFENIRQSDSEIWFRLLMDIRGLYLDSVSERIGSQLSEALKGRDLTTRWAFECVDESKLINADEHELLQLCATIQEETPS